MRYLAVCAPGPYLLRIDDGVRARELFHAQAGIEIEPYLLVSLVYQLAAIKGILSLGVQKIQVIGFAELLQRISGWLKPSAGDTTAMRL